MLDGNDCRLTSAPLSPATSIIASCNFNDELMHLQYIISSFDHPSTIAHSTTLLLLYWRPLWITTVVFFSLQVSFFTTMYALPLFAVAFLAGHAAANEHALQVRSTMLFDRADISAGKGIDPDDIPEQCKSDCADVLDAMQTCTSIDCLCTDKAHNGLGSCMQCAVGLVPNDTTTFSQAQDKIANYESQCLNATGVDLKPIQLSKPGASGGTTIAIASGGVAAAVGLVMAALSL
ncbi:hypothetical protein C8Q74DRAFT_313149 [Fomes fomentarius]|nr:hypothetical protein C8Q74DRAFT_313149 [Fomes fomentarius]